MTLFEAVAVEPVADEAVAVDCVKDHGGTSCRASNGAEWIS